MNTLVKLRDFSDADRSLQSQRVFNCQQTFLIFLIMPACFEFSPNRAQNSIQQQITNSAANCPSSRHTAQDLRDSV